ncbi:type I-E CRISPR-associated protein Cse1/CasA, partial [Streptomyces sp. SID11233]|nr:type I-E CRISPR-associated protein Cse1/CasA [Streptomyces sp. SID11233]
LLTATVIVSDWIASNPDLFPYFPEEHPRPETERVTAAWRGLLLPAPWEPAEPAAPTAAFYASRFALPPGAVVRPVQEQALAMARDMERPGMLIIEAPMGEGKTEAALAVAEVFAARSGAGGCYVALPTMATSNAMFPRLLRWLRRLPFSKGESIGRDHEQRSVLLAHAKSALQEDYATLMRESHRTIAAVDAYGDGSGPRAGRRPATDGSRGLAPAELVAHQWLRGRKKG